MNIEDFADGSDSSDEDYVPDTHAALPSEEESDGDVEDELGDSGNAPTKGRKRRKKGSSKKKKAKHDNTEGMYALAVYVQQQVQLPHCH